jgi:hypothetical protein
MAAMNGVLIKLAESSVPEFITRRFQPVIATGTPGLTWVLAEDRHRAW